MQFPFSSRRTTPGAAAFRLLWAVPCALIGVLIAYGAFRTISLALTMQAWPTVPATLQTVELEPGSRRTVQVTATYTYLVNGRHYAGKRASLYGADNIGDFHQRLYDELETYLSHHAPYPAHINPRDVRESILSPALRWEITALSFAGVALFGGAGFGQLAFSLFIFRRARTESQLAARYPLEPWRHRAEWASNRIKSLERANALSVFVFAFFLTGCTVPMLLTGLKSLADQEYGQAAFMALFPLAGVGFLAYAGVIWTRARRFGNTTLELLTFPAHPGQRFQARLYAPSALNDAKSVQVELRCLNTSRSVMQNRTAYETKTLWQNTMTAHPQRGGLSGTESILEISLDLPETQPVTSSPFESSWIAWRLSASAKLAGADFEAGFEVPVFADPKAPGPNAGTLALDEDDEGPDQDEEQAHADRDLTSPSAPRRAAKHSPQQSSREMASPRESWGLRIVLVGFLALLGAFFFYTVLRWSPTTFGWYADRLAATGEIEIWSQADARVQAAFQRAVASAPSDSSLQFLQADKRRRKYQVRVIAPDRTQALNQLNALLTQFAKEYGGEFNRDYSTSASSYVPPVVSSRGMLLKRLLTFGLLFLGLALIGSGAWLYRSKPGATGG